MSTLIRLNPFREMMAMRDSVDRLLEDAFTSADFDWGSSVHSLPLDVTENDSEFLVKTSIPGVKPEDVAITYTNNVLTIKREIKEDEEIKNAQVHLRERRYGNFSRSISLPSQINSDKIEAKYENGVLTLHLPKSDEVKPKKITVNVTSPKMLEGQSKK